MQAAIPFLVFWTRTPAGNDTEPSPSNTCTYTLPSQTPSTRVSDRYHWYHIHYHEASDRNNNPTWSLVNGAAAKTTTPTQPKNVPGRLWRVARAVLYMLRRGVMPSGRKLAMDVRRGRIAGKALGGFVSFHRHAAAARSSSVAAKRREEDEAAGCFKNYNAADIARVFEMLSDSGNVFDDEEDALAMATPSPALHTLGCGAAAGQLRVTDSPFAASEHQQVDSKAEEFIKRLYEQLRAQQSLAATPDYYGYAARRSVAV